MTLPAVAAPVLAAAVDGLPARLRRKLDEAVALAAGWPVSVVDDRTVVRVDDATTVTLPPPDRPVTDPAEVTCSCLLAPNCMHRAAVLARAPVADPVPTTASDDGSTVAPTGEEDPPAGGPVRPGSDAPVPLTDAQRAAAEQLWQAGVAVLSAGISGAGVVLRTALLQATHEARVHGLHRAAALGREVAAHLAAAREHEPRFRLADLTDAIRELLDVTRRLADPDRPATETAALVGAARRRYDVRGSLRLFGLCSVPAVAESGYGGVVTYLADRDARLWMVTDLMPGGEQRAAASAYAPVALGEAALTHGGLARGGLVVSGATASDTGALGAGRAVRAVAADGCAWTDEPLAQLWATPLDTQVTRAFAALSEPVGDRAAGADLLFLAVRLAGPAPGGVAAVTGDGLGLTLAAASDHAALPYRENLSVLAGAPGLDVLVVGRPDPARPRTVHPLALAGPGLNLPADRGGRVDLGYDRLRPEQLAAGSGSAIEAAEPSDDLALRLVRRHAERVVAGGRAAQALATADEQRVRAARLDTGAALLRALTTAAQASVKDAFGRPAADGSAAFARAWLSVAVYERAAGRALVEASWRTGLGDDPG